MKNLTDLQCRTPTGPDPQSAFRAELLQYILQPAQFSTNTSSAVVPSSSSFRDELMRTVEFDPAPNSMFLEQLLRDIYTR